MLRRRGKVIFSLRTTKQARRALSSGKDFIWCTDETCPANKRSWVWCLETWVNFSIFSSGDKKGMCFWKKMGILYGGRWLSLAINSETREKCYSWIWKLGQRDENSWAKSDVGLNRFSKQISNLPWGRSTTSMMNQNSLLIGRQQNWSLCVPGCYNRSPASFVRSSVDRIHTTHAKSEFRPVSINVLRRCFRHQFSHLDRLIISPMKLL